MFGTHTITPLNESRDGLTPTLEPCQLHLPTVIAAIRYLINKHVLNVTIQLLFVAGAYPQEFSGECSSELPASDV